MLARKQLNYDPFTVLEERARNTPDWDALKKATVDEFPVFVTGQMRRHRAENSFLNGCNYYGAGITWNSNFIMKHSNYGGKKAPEPLVFHLEAGKINWTEIGHYFNPNELKGIEGEIYGVPISRLAALDTREGNTEGITRKLVYIRMLSPVQNGYDLRCFMYVVDIDFFMECFSPNVDLEFAKIVKYPKNDMMAAREVYTI